MAVKNDRKKELDSRHPSTDSNAWKVFNREWTRIHANSPTASAFGEGSSNGWNFIVYFLPLRFFLEYKKHFWDTSGPMRGKTVAASAGRGHRPHLQIPMP